MTALLGVRRHLCRRRDKPAVVFAAAETSPLPGWLCDRLADSDPPDRSAAFHGLVSGCWYAGLDLAQSITDLQSWPPGVDKYGKRLSAEVERSWRKIAGVAS